MKHITDSEENYIEDAATYEEITETEIEEIPEVFTMTIEEVVASELENTQVLRVAKAYAGFTLGKELVRSIVLDEYIKGFKQSEQTLEEFVDDTPLGGFLYDFLYDKERVKPKEFFSTEAEAQQQGYEWFEDYGEWFLVQT